jgi:O-antigen/teichoic acid export membrane protein
MSEVVSQIASAASAYLFPAVSRLDVGHTGLTERTVRITLIVVMASGLVIALLAPLLLEVFFGPDYAAGAGALRITMVAMIPLSLNRLMAGDMKGRGRAGLVSVSVGCALVATVAFDLLLIPPLGIEGASLASLIAYSTGAGVLLAAYRRVTGSSLRLLVPTVADARLLVAASLRVLRHDSADPG